MKYTLTCEWHGGREELGLDDGVYYVAYGDEGVHLFSKPTRGKHFTLIVDRGALHIVHEGIAKLAAAGVPLQIDDVTVTIHAASAMPIHVAGYARAALQYIRTHAKPVAVVTTAAVIVVLTAYIVTGRHDDRARDAVVVRGEQSVVDDIEKARAVGEMRYKLAEKALVEGYAEKALRVVDQIIKANPQDARALALRDRAVRQAEEERRHTREMIARDAWIQRAMADATRRMADGDPQGARFIVLEVLESDPGNARAAELKERVTAEIAARQEQEKLHAAQQVQIADEARRLFEKGRERAERGLWAEAYHDLKQSAEMIAEHGLHPDFEVDLHEQLQTARGIVEQTVKDLVARAQESYARGSSQSALASKADYFRQALEHLKDAQAMSGTEEDAALKQSILTAFDTALEPLYIEAVTLQELEGCCFAHARFKQIKEIAKFSEVHHYKASDLAMSRCPCER